MLILMRFHAFGNGYAVPSKPSALLQSCPDLSDPLYFVPLVLSQSQKVVP